MKKRLVIYFLVLYFGLSLIEPVSVNASFIDDVKNRLRDTWFSIQVNLPFVPKSPKLVMWKMSSEMEKVKTATMKMNVDAKIQGKTPVEFILDMEAKPLEFDTKTASDDVDMIINGQIRMQGITVNVKGQFIQKGNDMFFKLTEVPSFGEYNLSKMIGVWFKVPLSPLTGLTPTPSLSKETSEKLTVILKEEVDMLMGKALSLQDEKLENEDVYHVQVVLTKEDFSRILVKIANTMGGSNESASEMTKNIESMRDVTLDLLINKKTWRLAKASFQTIVETVEPAFPGLSEQSSGFVESARMTTMDVSMSIYLKDYDVPFTVVAPSGAQDFDTTGFMLGLMGQNVPATGSGMTSPSVFQNYQKNPPVPSGFVMPTGFEFSPEFER